MDEALGCPCHASGQRRASPYPAGGRHRWFVWPTKVRLLTDLGRRAIRLDDGMLEWRLSELPVDASDLT
ncbi:hypothetical protein BM536_007695 [Streptomyces phaeoluteigriseus]|uniref:Rhodanese domain-containing protein n=1 Tax=Streptomyces phaeoluteigriseus TaxID=114686 RepID=A0A1V6MX17_9ACTN|nr:hypothetical protein [Streptomyces phaeoluteigriseus]OQD56827.1 hypothetical protein BM536_007695 [Streptomyces phaeoluteigriseus]